MNKPDHPPFEAALRDALERLCSGSPAAPLSPSAPPGADAEIAALVDAVATRCASMAAEIEALRERVERGAEASVSARMSAAATMAGGMAHEINNPLAYVMGNASFALDQLERAEAAPTSEVRRAVIDSLNDVVEGARRIAELIARLRRLAPARAVRATVMDPERLVDGALAMVRNVVGHRAALSCEHLGAPLVRADEAALSRVVVSLVHNAGLSFRASDLERNRVQVRTFRGPEGEAVIEVRDNGRGIAPEDLPRIFETFHGGEDFGGGVGLGLSISQHAVAAAGGRIDVESEPGVGSAFRVVLPPVVEPGRREPLLRLRAADPTARARILVIDDDPLLARLIGRSLRGHDVVIVTSGREALVRTAAEPFDVIVCDLMMRGMDGREFYDVLIGDRPELVDRFLFVTGGAFTPELRRFEQEVGGRLLRKPFAASELRAAVTACLRRPVEN